MDPDAIDHVVRKYAGELGLDRGYSAHSMRATFITTALENGAQLEDGTEGRPASRPRRDQALRSARVQSGEGGIISCDVLSLDKADRD
jgi:hypothetical protein